MNNEKYFFHWYPTVRPDNSSIKFVNFYRHDTYFKITLIDIFCTPPYVATSLIGYSKFFARDFTWVRLQAESLPPLNPLESHMAMTCPQKTGPPKKLV